MTPRALTVLVAGSANPECAALVTDLEARGEHVRFAPRRLRDEDFAAPEPDLIVSYNSRVLMPRAVFERPRLGAVNLHISLLPWNRGADPNFWSHLEGTPSGVSIHHIDDGLDSGDLIAQEQVAFQPDDTLESSYQELHRRVRALFFRIWPLIREGRAPRTPQATGGTLHRPADRGAFEHLLQANGWKTPLADLRQHRVDHDVVHRGQ